MSEANYQKRVMLALSRIAPVWRNNVGTAWHGIRRRLVNGDLLLSQARPVDYGLCVGASDLIAVLPVTIKPEHVGQTLGVFTAIECKAHNTVLQPDQMKFLEAVAHAGGIAILAREGNDAHQRVLTEIDEGKAVWGRVHGAVPRS